MGRGSQGVEVMADEHRANAWETSTRSLLQSDLVRIDPAADWYFRNNRVTDRMIPVLIELQKGVSPRDLLRPPRGEHGERIDPADWARNLMIEKAYLSEGDGRFTAGYCTGYATWLFVEWLRDDAGVQTLVSSLTLSQSSETGRGRP
jgi:hypothetical protein